jgi:hypothetical protein
MDIFEILKKDHGETLSRFRELEKTTSQESAMRNKGFTTLNQELIAHLEAEEDTFYQPLMHGKYREDALEALEEHHVLELVLEDLSGTEPGVERWKPKLRVLKEMLEHHIGEEEGKIFTEIKTILSKGMAEELGVQFSARKGEILSETGYS